MEIRTDTFYDGFWRTLHYIPDKKSGCAGIVSPSLYSSQTFEWSCGSFDCFILRPDRLTGCLLPVIQPRLHDKNQSWQLPVLSEEQVPDDCG